jgi:tetratricopeptide (TPR) repeat protein
VRDQEVRRAHARYFSTFARQLQDRLRGPERDSLLDELGSEIGNLRSAWRFWVDQADLEQLFDLIDGLWALHEAKGWYHAAIELATDTLGVLARAEASPEHAAEELILRTSLARALMAVRGYGVEVEEEFKRALEIAEATGTAAHSFPVLRALATYYMNIADFGKGVELGRRLLYLGEKEDDEAIRIEGHYVFGAATAFMGDLETGLPHLDRAIELHDSRKHNSTRFRLGPSTGVVARVASGLILWQCGALDKAVGRLREALVIARELDHPYSIAFALYHNGFLAMWRNQFEECLGHAHELASVANENDYLVWKTLATVLEGVALTSLGRTDEGLALTETGIELYQGLTTPPIFWPLILTLRATVHALAGKPERALELINEAIKLGAPEELVSPDFRIFKGDFIRMLPEPDLAAAEAAYQAAIRGAKATNLHMIELHALTKLVALHREMGISPDGREDLSALYGTFTEGFDEDHLVLAREILGLPRQDQEGTPPQLSIETQ